MLDISWVWGIATMSEYHPQASPIMLSEKQAMLTICETSADECD